MAAALKSAPLRTGEIVDAQVDAILERKRSANVRADTVVKCLEPPLDAVADCRRLHPNSRCKSCATFSALLARRLIAANAKVDLLSAY